MKIWNALTEEGQEFVLIAGFILECWILFGIMP